MSQPNPNDTDAILGGQTPPPVNAVILGGLAGLKQRLESTQIADRLRALNESIEYGDKAIDLALESLSDSTEEVKRLARRLLRGRLGTNGKQALLDRELLSYFTTLNDWRREIYNPEIGITDPENNAYVVEIHFSTQRNNYGFDFSQLEALTKDPKISELQAVIFDIYSDDWLEKSQCSSIIDAICNAGSVMKDVKALFVGQAGGYDPYELIPRFIIVDLLPFLNTFPNLELLQLHGMCSEPLTGEGASHQRLRTLIIQSSQIAGGNIAQICPSLEYLKLSLGGDSGVNRNSIASLLCGDMAPKLKYLGVCYSGSWDYWDKENVDECLNTLMESSFTQQLYVLSLEHGYIKDEQVSQIINSSNLSNLKILNLTGNCLSSQGIELLQQLPYKVETRGQNDINDDRYWAAYE
jgi:hypothetical protein